MNVVIIHRTPQLSQNQIAMTLDGKSLLRVRCNCKGIGGNVGEDEFNTK